MRMAHVAAALDAAPNVFMCSWQYLWRILTSLTPLHPTTDGRAAHEARHRAHDGEAGEAPEGRVGPAPPETEARGESARPRPKPRRGHTRHHLSHAGFYMDMLVLHSEPAPPIHRAERSRSSAGTAAGATTRSRPRSPERAGLFYGRPEPRVRVCFPRRTRTDQDTPHAHRPRAARHRLPDPRRDIRPRGGPMRALNRRGPTRGEHPVAPATGVPRTRPGHADEAAEPPPAPGPAGEHPNPARAVLAPRRRTRHGSPGAARTDATPP